VELGNWRGVYGAPGITAAQRKAVTDMVLAALATRTWREALARYGWTPAVLAGPAFDAFVAEQFEVLRATMLKAGMA
ncbi:MAG: tripartite tricarboxylate transporter substrate binding protein, partial [Burkholderiales bacterium]